MSKFPSPNEQWLASVSNKYKKKSNTQIVLDALEEAMLHKDLLPGQMLPSEADLAASLNIGKSSVREAIKMLEGIGVVNVVQGKGSFIQEDFKAVGTNLFAFKMILAEKNHEDLVEFRYMFEPMYMKIALKKVTPAHISLMEDMVESLKDKITQGVLTPEDDTRFHEYILQITGNPIIIGIGTILNKMLHFSLSSAVITRPRQIYDDHSHILEIFKTKDEAVMDTAVRGYIDHWIKNYWVKP